MCEHEQWQASAKVIRLTDTEDGPVTGWTVELEVTCATCLTFMQWVGVPMGSSPSYPTVNPTAVEIRLPCRPLVATAKREIGEVS